MIWISISLVLCTAAICYVILSLHNDRLYYKAAMNCLLELVYNLNNKFPGSSLTVLQNKDEIKVEGELKYYTKDN